MIEIDLKLSTISDIANLKNGSIFKQNENPNQMQHKYSKFKIDLIEYMAFYPNLSERKKMREKKGNVISGSKTFIIETFSSARGPTIQLSGQSIE